MYNSDFVRNSQCDYSMLQFYPSTYIPMYQPPNQQPVNFQNNDQANIGKYSFLINQRKNDAQFFTSFINENTTNELKKESSSKRLGVSATKTLMASIKMLNTDLKELILSLRNEIDCGESEWREKMNQCRAVQLKIEEYTKKLQDADEICSFQRMIEKRKNKRRREKKVNDQWIAMKQSLLERRSRLHAAIDAWISEKQNVIEREKQEAIFMKDADMILSDIRAKRNDSRKYLGHLNELHNLRRVKVSNARARGENQSAAADEAFENIIGQLTDQWSILDREYATEEQGLKLMLKTDNEKVIAKQKKNNYNDWEIAIFGRRLPSGDAAYKDMNNLILTRFLWDKYINYRKGSRIPIGWVMPSTSSSTPWERCLKRKI